MANVNKAFIIGRLTKDPELRRTQSDLSVASFAVAVNKRGKDAGTDFIDCTAWRNTADFVSKYFKKGDPILVVGSISTRSYEDKNGNKRKAYEIIADNVHFAGNKSDAGTGGGDADDSQFVQAQAAPTAQVSGFEVVTTDDLPF